MLEKQSKFTFMGETGGRSSWYGGRLEKIRFEAAAYSIVVLVMISVGTFQIIMLVDGRFPTITGTG